MQPPYPPMPKPSVSETMRRSSSPYSRAGSVKPGLDDSNRKSCAECRRRKLKCDRKIPCSSCKEKGRPEICPDKTWLTKSDRLQEEVDRLRKQVEILQQGGNPRLAVEEKAKGKAPASSSDGRDSEPMAPPEGSGWMPGRGTLVVAAHDGRTRYFGPNAASEWLNDSAEDGAMTAALQPEPTRSASGFGASGSAGAHFPFGSASAETWPTLKAFLPPLPKARSLIQNYWDLYAFNYNVISPAQLEEYMHAIYTSGADPHWNQATHPHKLGLVFMVLAMGTLLDLDSMEAHEDSKRYLEAAETCLSIVNLLQEHNVATVQTLHVMANFHSYDDRLRGGDRTWPIGGLAMRLAEAMGMHRDGKIWGLPADVVEARRTLFWELHTEETFMAHGFGRPGHLFSRHFDVEYPQEDPNWQFATTRYKLVRISSSILDTVMSIEPPAYEKVLGLYRELVELEKGQSKNIRWTTGPTTFSFSDMPWSQTTTENKQALTLALRRHTLCLNINETVLFLLRNYFARALRDNPADPSKSKYKEAYGAVFERCQTIIAIAKQIYTLHPRAAIKHWYFWYHACSAAVCLGSIPTFAPFSPGALTGWLQLQSACVLFSGIAHQSKSTMASLALLLRVRSSAFDKMSGPGLFGQDPMAAPPSARAATVSPAGDRPDDADEEQSSQLMGMKTTLVHRKGRILPSFDIAAGLPPQSHTGSSEEWQPRIEQQSPALNHPGFSYDVDDGLRPGATAGWGLGGASQPQDLQTMHAIRDEALNFNLDGPSFAYLSSMRPGTWNAAAPPMESTVHPDWSDLDLWLGVLGQNGGAGGSGT